MTTPAIGYWMWFYSQFGSPDDFLAVLVSNDNGASWVPADTLRGLHNRWEEHAIDVARYVAPTSQVRVRFVAADFGVNSVVEAGIDDITTYDASLPAVDRSEDRAPLRLAFRAPAPNPAREAVDLTLDVPRPGRLDIDVVDLAGRRVASLHGGPAPAGTLHVRWNGAGPGGGPTPPGLYFARARLDGTAAEARIVRVR